jgi:hypothetical protein
MKPKDFLLEECQNVRRTLRDVLRHDYAAGSSRDFYNEFCERLDFLEFLLAPVASDDVSALHTFADEVSLLSTLVHHIERSHAGEFPWSFTEYLQQFATPLCREDLAQIEGEPILRVYAEGGLYSYQINLENDLSVLNIGRRIFTIVFPRTLKHHVLLHAIFGHEIGHAAWTIPKHRAELRDKVLEPLRSTGPLNSTSQATDWLRKSSAPPTIQELRDQYGDPSYTDISRNQLDSWFQEFMCDLFGLVSFGPSFLAAHQTLLLALDPTGHRWGPYHPPYVCRKAMLWHACKHLKWDQFSSRISNSGLKADYDRFFETYIGSNAPAAWEDVFTAKQVEDAVDALTAFLPAAGSPCFSLPEQGALSSLIDMLRDEIPPCGSDLSGSREPKNKSIDFRHILFAGWIVAEQPPAPNGSEKEQLDFLKLNKLSEMGLLQQRAIDIYNAKRQEAPA